MAVSTAPPRRYEPNGHDTPVNGTALPGVIPLLPPRVLHEQDKGKPALPTWEEFLEKFRPLHMHFLPEAWELRRDNEDDLDDLAGRHAVRLKALLRDMAEWMAVTLTPTVKQKLQGAHLRYLMRSWAVQEGTPDSLFLDHNGVRLRKMLRKMYDLMTKGE